MPVQAAPLIVGIQFLKAKTDVLTIESFAPRNMNWEFHDKHT